MFKKSNKNIISKSNFLCNKINDFLLNSLLTLKQISGDYSNIPYSRA